MYNQRIRIMKKWQKITGIIVFILIAIYELLAWANTYVYMKYIVEPTDNDLRIIFRYVDEFSVSYIFVYMFMAEKRKR